MKPSITLGRLFGVDIKLHYSWFIIALLITLSLVSHRRTLTRTATQDGDANTITWTA